MTTRCAGSSKRRRLCPTSIAPRRAVIGPNWKRSGISKVVAPGTWSPGLELYVNAVTGNPDDQLSAPQALDANLHVDALDAHLEIVRAIHAQARDPHATAERFQGYCIHVRRPSGRLGDRGSNAVRRERRAPSAHDEPRGAQDDRGNDGGYNEEGNGETTTRAEHS